jgi:hypothetical protein
MVTGELKVDDKIKPITLALQNTENTMKYRGRKLLGTSSIKLPTAHNNKD